MPEDDADTMHMALTLPFILVYSICSVLIIIGIALVIIGLIKRSKLKVNRKF